MKTPRLSVVHLLLLLLLCIPLTSNSANTINPYHSFSQSNYFVLNTNTIGFSQCLSIGDSIRPNQSNSQPIVSLGVMAPNPFNPIVNISFHVASKSEVELRVFDVSGRCVRHLVTQVFAAGANTWQWNGRNDRGSILPAGMYLVQLKNQFSTQTNKVTLLK